MIAADELLHTVNTDQQRNAIIMYRDIVLKQIKLHQLDIELANHSQYNIDINNHSRIKQLYHVITTGNNVYQYWVNRQNLYYNRSLIVKFLVCTIYQV